MYTYVVYRERERERARKGERERGVCIFVLYPMCMIYVLMNYTIYIYDGYIKYRDPGFEGST